MNMARVQCSTSSHCEGGGGNFGCSTRSHPSKRNSFFPTSDSVAKRKLGAALGGLFSPFFCKHWKWEKIQLVKKKKNPIARKKLDAPSYTVDVTEFSLSSSVVDAMAEFTFHTDLFNCGTCLFDLFKSGKCHCIDGISIRKIL